MPLKIRSVMYAPGAAQPVPTYELVDVNGDGLLDLVHALDPDGSGWTQSLDVYKNTGSAFILEKWASNSPYRHFRVYPNRLLGQQAPRDPDAGHKYVQSDTTGDLVDVTGDGCPDLVVLANFYRNKACDVVPPSPNGSTWTQMFDYPVALSWLGPVPPNLGRRWQRHYNDNSTQPGVGVQLICVVGVVLKAVGNVGAIVAPAGITPDVILVFTAGSGLAAATVSTFNTPDRIT